MDMGGTSTDISLVLDGRPQLTREGSLAGTPIRVPVIDISNRSSPAPTAYLTTTSMLALAGNVETPMLDREWP